MCERVVRRWESQSEVGGEEYNNASSMFGSIQRRMFCCGVELDCKALLYANTGLYVCSMQVYALQLAAVLATKKKRVNFRKKMWVKNTSVAVVQKSEKF